MSKEPFDNDALIAEREAGALEGLRAEQLEAWPRFKEFMHGHGKMAVLGGLGGTGKLQPNTEPVLTPGGWVPMGDIKPGMFVVGSQGYAVKVLETFPGKDLKIYRVDFCDGTFTHCCEDHLWQVQTQKDIQKGKSRVLPFSEILGKIDHRNATMGYYYSIPLCKPVEYGHVNEYENGYRVGQYYPNFDLDPYLVGWLIGDGCLATPGTNQVSSSIFTRDIDWVEEKIRGIASKNVKVSRIEPSPSAPNVARLYFSIDIHQQLREIGLLGQYSHEKRIPREYMLGSIQQRKDLLAGLMDTDGSVLKFNSKRLKIRFHSSSEGLSLDVCELVRSLGGYATMSVSVRNDKDRPEYNVNIRTWFNPFQLPAKADVYGGYIPTFKRIKKMIGAEYVGKMDGQCLRVDAADSLYLTRDFIVTHNTYSVAQYCKALGLAPGEVLGIAPTNVAAKILAASFAKTGFAAQATTAHKALHMAPKKVTWNGAKDREMLEAKIKLDAWDETEDFDPGEYAETRLIHDRLRRELDAFKKEELIFTPMAFHADEQVRLYIVDECSMLGAELYEVIALTLIEHGKVLFMGDPNQLFPVGEGLSPSFNNPHIANFTDVQRAAGYIAALAKEVVACQSLETAKQILYGVQHWKDFDVEQPWEIPEGEAAIVSRSDAKAMFQHWAKELPRSGYSYRMITYKNESVDKANIASLKFGGIACPPVGSNIIANKPVSRWCFKSPSKVVLLNSEVAEVTDTFAPYMAKIPGFGAIPIHVLEVALECTIEPDETNFYERPNHFLGDGHRGDLGTVAEIKWTGDPAYAKALDTWGGIKNAIYSQGKPPGKENQHTAQLFEWLGIDSWTNIKGAKGFKQFKKVDVNLEMFLIGACRQEKQKFLDAVVDAEGDVCFDGLRKQIYKLYRWLSDTCVDPVRPLSASTVYKCQGATIERVVVYLPEILESRKYGKDAHENCYRAIYTAMSRASKQLFIMV